MNQAAEDITEAVILAAACVVACLLVACRAEGAVMLPEQRREAHTLTAACRGILGE